MGFLEKDLPELKEGFWKEPINEAARVSFENDKVTIHGPVASQAEIDTLLKGKHLASIVTREEDGYSMFNAYHMNNGDNFYIVMPKQGDDTWIVQVSSQARGSKKTWWSKDDRKVSPEQADQIMAALEIPTGDTSESVIK
jgi:hypothetical protein